MGGGIKKMAFSPKYGFLFLRLVAQEENILSRLLIKLKACRGDEVFCGK